MKQWNLWLLLGLVATFASCSKKDQEAAAVSLTINVQYNEEGKSLNLPINGVNVTLSNLSNGQSYTTKTNSNGEADFTSIIPGTYSGSASFTISAADYTAATGIPVDQDVQYNASFTGNSFVQSSNSISLTLESGKIGDLVIKQFYYAGSNTTTGASFRDEFVEIYNNSNDTIYLDSLYVGNTRSNSSVKLSAGGTTYDWSTSINMAVASGDPTKDYIYFRYIFMIPGSGKDHPLAPGTSVVLAQTAINHAATYTDNTDKVVSITDPTLSVDLSKADFESYCVEYDRAKSTDQTTFTPYRYDLDNPQVPNLDVKFIAQGNDWVFDATGREDLVLFRVPSDETTSFPSFYDPLVTADNVKSTTIQYMQVPLKDVIDAMEILTPLPTNRYPKRLQTSLDATGTFVTGGQYSSQSLVRKTLKVLSSGRRILQDTNNSSDDFFTKTKADPSKSDNSFKE